MNIWVDADACPKSIKNILFRVAIKRQVKIYFVANSLLQLPESDYINFILVEHGPDIADNKIVEDSSEGDLVITADIPLAVKVVAKGALGLDPRGRIYDKSNIGGISDIRDFMNTLRNDGVVTGGPNSFSNKDSGKFANALDKLIVRKIINRRGYA